MSEAAEYDAKDPIYLCGNSLGLQPQGAREQLVKELDDWAKPGIILSILSF